MRDALVTVAAVLALVLEAENALAGGAETPADPQLAQSGAQPEGGVTAPAAGPRKRPETGAPEAVERTRAASLEGRDLIGPAGEKIGRIEKVAGDRMIVSVGGFLGIGAKTVLLSEDQIDIARTGRGVEVVTGLTEAALKAMPEYKADEGAPRADGNAGTAR